MWSLIVSARHSTVCLHAIDLFLAGALSVRSMWSQWHRLHTFMSFHQIEKTHTKPAAIDIKSNIMLNKETKRTEKKTSQTTLSLCNWKMRILCFTIETILMRNNKSTEFVWWCPFECSAMCLCITHWGMTMSIHLKFAAGKIVDWNQLKHPALRLLFVVVVLVITLNLSNAMEVNAIIGSTLRIFFYLFANTCDVLCSLRLDNNFLSLQCTTYWVYRFSRWLQVNK